VRSRRRCHPQRDPGRKQDTITDNIGLPYSTITDNIGRPYSTINLIPFGVGRDRRGLRQAQRMLLVGLTSGAPAVGK
jgi:hypothetical protein